MLQCRRPSINIREAPAKRRGIRENGSLGNTGTSGHVRQQNQVQRPKAEPRTRSNEKNAKKKFPTGQRRKHVRPLPPISLEDLPNDVLWAILELLPRTDWMSLTTVSRGLRAAVKLCDEWRKLVWKFAPFKAASFELTKKTDWHALYVSVVRENKMCAGCMRKSGSRFFPELGRPTWDLTSVPLCINCAHLPTVTAMLLKRFLRVKSWCFHLSSSHPDIISTTGLRRNLEDLRVPGLPMVLDDVIEFLREAALEQNLNVALWGNPAKKSRPAPWLPSLDPRYLCNTDILGRQLSYDLWLVLRGIERILVMMQTTPAGAYEQRNNCPVHDLLSMKHSLACLLLRVTDVTSSLPSPCTRSFLARS
eukprot:Rmarinus@m.26878